MVTHRINGLSFQLGRVHKTLSEVIAWTKDPRKPLNMFLLKLAVLHKLWVQVSEKQVTNMRRNEKLKGRSGGDAAEDDLNVVMQRADTEDPSAQFIHGIRTASCVGL